MNRLSYVCLVCLYFASASARADIFQWEYVNPGNPALGKQPSTTLCVDGAGVSAVPYTSLYGDLTMAYLIGADLTGAHASSANLTNADLSNAILADADLRGTLTGADLTGAVVRGVSFSPNGITSNQLYSTASYLAHDLPRINFDSGVPEIHAGLDGWNFAGQNLTSASFERASLGSANFHQANLTNANFQYASMANVNLSQANLTNANVGADLYGANFAGAEVRGALLPGQPSFTPSQLYSTASYQAHDLTGIRLSGNSTNFGAWNFAGQNLTNATLSDDWNNANFSQANLTNVVFTNGRFAGANLTGAEVRGANFTNDGYYGSDGFSVAQLYTTASYKAHDLTGINVAGRDFTGGDFTGQNLTNASFSGTKLTGAVLAGAEVRGASFNRVYIGYPINDYLGGITLAQLYSTASYQAHNLTGISLNGNDMMGANFAGQNLTNANLSGANLSGADLTNAEVRGTNLAVTAAQLYSTASYQARDLTDIRLGGDLTGADLSNQNLTNAGLGATLDGADFTGAVVRGADLGYATYRGFTAPQLYSTASYQAHDLTGIYLHGNDLTGWNFAGQRLTGAQFGGATLIDANFSGANLNKARVDQTIITGANFSNANLSETFFYNATTFGGVNFSGANLQNAYLEVNYNADYCDFYACNTDPVLVVGADMRGASVYLPSEPIYTNAIRSDGHVAGLDLAAGQLLVVRDYDGGINNFGNPIPPTPVTVDQHLAMGPGGTLRMVFEANAWDSTISFAAGIPVALGGSLDLTFAADVNLVSQVGRTIDLFNWTGVTPTGAFGVTSPYIWDLSQLYTTGEVTLKALTALPGDYDGNGIVDTHDYDVWKTNFGSTTLLAADGNGNHVIDAADYSVWRDHLGATLGSGSGSALPSAGPLSASVPEPSALILFTVGLAALVTTRRA